MKKRFLSIMLTLSMLMVFIPTAVLADTYGDLSYTVNADNTITIIGCDTSAKNVTIPNKINGLPVTSIGSGAFYCCFDLKNIVIPDSITSIEDGAINFCQALTNLTIPNSVKYIGAEAFANCALLESVVLPEDITSISDWMFWECTSLKTITIPDKVTSIGERAFDYCKSLTSITIPKNVKNIGNNTFRGCDALTDIYFMGTEKQWKSISMYDYASEDLSNVTIHFNNTLSDPEDYLEYIISNDEVTITGCDKTVTKVEIPTEIDGFQVTSIAAEAFLNCTKLNTITLPNSLKSIGIDAFLNTAYYNNKSNWIGGVLYIGKYLIQAKSSEISAVYTIKEGTKTIAYNAFAYCNTLTKITIPDSITNIGTMAFTECENLKDVYYRGTEEQWNAISIGSFNNALTNANLHCKVLTKPTTYTINSIAPTTEGVSLTVHPNEDLGGEQTVIVACYDEDGKFTGLQQKKIKTSDGEQSLNFEIEKENVDTVKAFVWNDIDYMMPASETKVLELNSNPSDKDIQITLVQDGNVIEATWNDNSYPNYYFKIVDSNNTALITSYSGRGENFTSDLANCLPRVDTSGIFSFVLYSADDNFIVGEELARLDDCIEITVEGEPFNYEMAFNTPETDTHTITLLDTIPAYTKRIDVWYKNGRALGFGSGYSSIDKLPGSTLTEIESVQDGDTYDLRIVSAYTLNNQVLKATITPASTKTYTAESEIKITLVQDGNDIKATWNNNDYPNYYFKIEDSSGQAVTKGWCNEGENEIPDLSAYLPRVETNGVYSFALYSATEDFRIGEEIARLENCFDISLDGVPIDYEIAFNTPEINYHSFTITSEIPNAIKQIYAWYRNNNYISLGTGTIGGTLTTYREIQDEDIFDLRILTVYTLEGQVLKATMTPASTKTYTAAEITE